MRYQQQQKRGSFYYGILPATVLAVLSICRVESFCQKLYVFVPCGTKPVYIEERMRDQFRDVEVRVFGFVGDFTMMVEKEAPQLVITKKEVLDSIGNYSIVLRAQRNDSLMETYSVLSVGDKLEPSSVGDKNIGVVDFLGRKRIKDFIIDILGVEPKKITRVKKYEDLLSLLSLDMVDGIVVSEQQYLYVKKRSKLDLQKVQCRNKAAIAVCAVSSNEGQLIDRVRRMPGELKALLGFDSWKE